MHLRSDFKFKHFFYIGNNILDCFFLYFQRHEYSPHAVFHVPPAFTGRLMFARAIHQLPDMIEQHRLSNDVEDDVLTGFLRTTLDGALSISKTCSYLCLPLPGNLVAGDDFSMHLTK